MGRLLRGTFKLAVISGIVAGVVAAAKKLMGGLGPTPGSPDAPKEWPSLVPDPAPATPSGADGPSDNGMEPLTPAEATDAPPAAIGDTATPTPPPDHTPDPEATEPTGATEGTDAAATDEGDADRAVTGSPTGAPEVPPGDEPGQPS
jgi:hypothetical protein